MRHNTRIVVIRIKVYGYRVEKYRDKYSNRHSTFKIN